MQENMQIGLTFSFFSPCVTQTCSEFRCLEERRRKAPRIREEEEEGEGEEEEVEGEAEQVGRDC